MDRIFYCRVGFILLCVVPTLATASAVTLRQGPRWGTDSKAAWEVELSQRLGFRVSLAKVTHPHAGTTLLEGVELADRETGETVARARLVEAAVTEQGRVLVVSQPEILVAELASLGGTLHEMLLRAPVGNALRGVPERHGGRSLQESIQIVAGELTLTSPRESQTFSGVECQIEQLSTGPRATIRFRLPQGKGEEPARLVITRNREHVPSTTRWELHTGGEPLPCSLLAAYVTTLAMLGSDCTFHGVAWGEETPAGWQGDISGKLSGVNLDRLVTHRFPHKLSGTAEITFNRARFLNGRLVDAAGSLEARSGAIGQTLVEAACDALKFETSERVAAVTRWPLRYERLALGFVINESGLSLSGTVDAEGTLLADRDGPLVSTPAKHTVPVVALVRSLSPASEVQVPATAETDALLRALPIPPLVPPENARRTPGTTVRLKNE